MEAGHSGGLRARVQLGGPYLLGNPVLQRRTSRTEGDSTRALERGSALQTGGADTEIREMNPTAELELRRGLSVTLTARIAPSRALALGGGRMGGKGLASVTGAREVPAESKLSPSQVPAPRWRSLTRLPGEPRAY